MTLHDEVTQIAKDRGYDLHALGDDGYMIVKTNASFREILETARWFRWIEDVARAFGLRVAA